VYDVDTTGTDTVAAVLLPLFRPSRFLGSLTIAPESLKDTIKIPISPDSVLDRVLSGKPLRIGLQLASSQSAELNLQSTQVGSGTSLLIRASKDTAVKPLVVSPLSHTPTDQSFLAGALADYVIVAKGLTVAPPTLLGVGGLPSRRTYLKLTIPAHIVDSSTIVRASLLLTQRPNRTGVNRSDTVSVTPLAVVSAPAVSDLFTALQFTSGQGSFGLGPLRTVPGDSGVKSIELVGLVRTWHGLPENLVPRAIALVSGQESTSGAEVDFFSTRAAAAVRPRLRIVYVPRSNFGIP
jgi:hypothetical protein